MGKELELLKAVKNNDYEKVEKLYNPHSGSFMKKKDKQNFPSSEELRRSGQILRLKHIDVDVQEEETGYTPLILAVLNGSMNIAVSLIHHNADINGQDFKGNTALHMATFIGRTDMTDLLVSAGAKVNKVNLDGNSPLHIACQAFSTGQLMLILKLLKAGGDPLFKNKAGATPLDITAMFNRIEAASALLDHEPKLQSNTTAIVDAATRGNTEIVQLLLDYGISPNSVDLRHRARPLHEAVRYERWETVKVLLSYGADPWHKNDKGETAELIAMQCHSDKAARFIKMFKEYENMPKQAPRFLKSDIISPKRPEVDSVENRYPLLKNQRTWTKNTQEFCNNCTAVNNNTNLLDDNLCSFWVIPAIRNAWVIFDLEHEHTLTGIRIIGWDSPQMVKTVELQKSTLMSGPWHTVTTFMCRQKGGQSPKDHGVPQDYLGFCATSRYWRLLIHDNHGGPCTCFQGVSFYGMDTRVLSVFENLGLMKYTEAFIQKGYNSYGALIRISHEDLESLVPVHSHRRTIMNALKDLKLKVFPIRQLVWLTAPISMARECEELPPIIVQADPETAEELEMVVLGKAEVQGNTRTFLKPQGPQEASVAAFNGIKITQAGRYAIEVHCVRFPQISLQAPQHIEIVQRAKDQSEVSAAFDELEDMLRTMQASLGDT